MRPPSSQLFKHLPSEGCKLEHSSALKLTNVHLQTNLLAFVKYIMLLCSAPILWMNLKYRTSTLMLICHIMSLLNKQPFSSKDVCNDIV